MRLLTKIVLVATIVSAAVSEVLFGKTGRDSAPPASKPAASSAAKPMKAWAFRIAAFFVALVFGALLFVISGIMPIAASSGHWPITAWFLHFAMRRSVATHSLGVETPNLEDPGLVIKGARHYEFGCRPCHGGPQPPMPVIASRMTPHPPHLPPEIPKWQPEELFYIVKHGVKFTGMPAWPAQGRDDEVWSVVAFLLKLPDLSPAEYEKLARSLKATAATIDNLAESKDAPRVISENCARCHAADEPDRRLDVFPRLAGQRPTYLYASLLAFARGERHSGIMGPLSASLSAADMREISLYYSRLPHLPAAPRRDETAAAIERGKEIATRGIPRQRVPACTACHGPGSTPRNPVYPDLAGQNAEYLALQLALFKSDSRGGTPYAHLMRMVAGRLTPEQIKDVTSYYAALSAPPRPVARTRHELIVPRWRLAS